MSPTDGSASAGHAMYSDAQWYDLSTNWAARLPATQSQW